MLNILCGYFLVSGSRLYSPWTGFVVKNRARRENEETLQRENILKGK
jgi:hypothetical protein